MIENNDFKNTHRKDKKDFTRKRNWTFPLVVLMILRKGVKSLQNRINEFFDKLEDEFPTTTSASSFTQARSKLLHTAYIELNEKCVVGNVYSEKYNQYKGYRVIGIDSSEVLLPDSKEIYQHFGTITTKNQYGRQIIYSCSKVSVMYDVLNHIAIDSIMGKSNSYEVDLAMNHFRFATHNDILIFDRGYPSYFLFAFLIQKNIPFLARCSRAAFKAARQMFDSAEESMTVELKPHKRQRKEVIEQNLPLSIKVRFIKVVLPTGEIEVLATSLVDKFTPLQFKELYNLRWGSETFYDVIKNRLDLQNFTGTTVESVMQDFFSTIFVTGVESIITHDVCDVLQQRNTQDKLPKKINKAGSFNTIKNHVLDLFFLEKDLDVLLEKLTKLFLSNTTCVQKFRDKPRKKGLTRKLIKYYRHRRKYSF